MRHPRGPVPGAGRRGRSGKLVNLLDWNLRFTEEQYRFLSKLAEQRRRIGRPIPKALRDKPTLREEHADLWIAFIDLSGSRTAGFGPEPIQISSVKDWCVVHGVPQWRWPTFWSVIR
ncbi:MAG: phage tail assembly chaperone, partial [Ilumatobacteraceae bacterium]